MASGATPSCVVPANAGTHNHQRQLFLEGVYPIALSTGRGV